MKLAIDLGTAGSHGHAGTRAMLDIEELLATRLLVQGNSGSGKSHLLRRLLEQSAPSIQQVVIDPEGDYVSLSERFGHVVVDANRSEADLECIAVRVRQHRVSVVLNLESLAVDGQMRAAAVFLNALFETEREYWYPALVAVDEAQLFAPAAAGDVAEDARKASLAAMTNLMCRGRKRGLAGIIATQRLAKLAKNVAAEASNFLMGRTFLDIDMARAADLLGMERRQAEVFRDLERGHFIALGPALSRRPLQVHVGAVETTAGGSTPSLMPLPDQPEAKDLILAPVPAAAPRVAPRRTAVPAPPSTNELLARLESDGRAPAEPDETTPALSGEERERLLRAILAEMMDDTDAFSRSEPVLFQDFLVRCRIKRVSGEAPGLPEFRSYLNTARVGVDPETAAGAEWRRVMEVADGVAEDVRVVFLLFARAAMTGTLCPSDLDVARISNTSSTARARSKIHYLDKTGVIVIRSDMRGGRIVAVPDLGWESAPGDPNAPEAALAQATEHIPA